MILKWMNEIHFASWTNILLSGNIIYVPPLSLSLYHCCDVMYSIYIFFRSAVMDDHITYMFYLLVYSISFSLFLYDQCTLLMVSSTFLPLHHLFRGLARSKVLWGGVENFLRFLENFRKLTGRNTKLLNIGGGYRRFFRKLSHNFDKFQKLMSKKKKISNIGGRLIPLPPL